MANKNKKNNSKSGKNNNNSKNVNNSQKANKTAKLDNNKLDKNKTDKNKSNKSKPNDSKSNKNKPISDNKLNSNDIELNVKINEKDMFFFMLGHVYSRLSSKITLIFSIICLVVFPISFLWHDTFTTLILLFGALLYLVISPLMLYLQSKKQFLTNPVYKEAIIYKINEPGFSVLQSGQWVDFGWDNLYKVVESKYNLLFYINKDQAFIIPNRLIEDKNMKNIEKIVSRKMESTRYKFKQQKNEGKI
ncbi:hypothetical protein SH1V18_29650 [Vallitalea longa]|uniref:YcxB-like C-terminal domain-containing protein n=1 Tax=Vallitalea longa TaxID=2936439 RepID=A0A9W5YDC9_9FIRM|nr:YcxB family protein [Vallitalea longa]GKX30485.1 hypothetical protein SH1V18_29650 [Vallitalea longa]